MFKTIHRFFLDHYHTHYENVYEHAKKLFAFDIFLLIVAATMLGGSIFFFFWTPGLTDQIDLKISLGNSHIKNGQNVKMIISYKNRSKYYLHQSILGVHLPNGFIVDREKTPSSTFRTDSTFDLKDLSPGSSGQVEIYGRLWVVPKQDETITALLSYLPENSKYKEQKLGNFLLNLSDNILSSSLQITTTSFANNRVPFVYKFVNTSEDKLDGLKFNINFAGRTVNLPNTTLQNITLEKNGEKLITGEVTMPAQPGKYNLTASVSANINNHEINILNTQASIETFSPQVTISFNPDNQPTFVEPNQIIEGTISWKNNGNFEINNTNIRLNFNPSVVDIQKTAKENGFKIDKKTILITSLQRTALSSIKNNDSDQFKIKIYLLPKFNLAGTENASLEIQPYFEGQLKDLTRETFSIAGQPTLIPLATELEINSEARYYSNEGDQLGRGPLPPKTNETTKYWIFIRISNTSNAVRDAYFYANLPSGIEFTGKQSVSIGSALTFNPANRTVTWNHYELPPNSQTGLYFEVAATPTINEIGKNITLVKNISFSATDKNTGKQFSLQKDTINNILPNIDMGSKKGSLVK